MKFFTPLEQFEILVFKPINFLGLIDISITNSTIYLLLSCILVFLFLKIGIHQSFLIPTPYQSSIELIYKFVLSIIKQQAGSSIVEFFPFFFTIFMFVLFSNLIGLLPFGFTTTGHIAVTFTLAFSINVGLFILGFVRHGLSFLKLFLPSGAPTALIPLIVVIEIVSYVLRSFSLSIRLFANMMAGHTLLFILSGFALPLINASTFFVALLPLVLVFAVVCLEFFIAFLQAYVFIVLLAIYFNDSLNFSSH